jgi:hypothetical protein
MGDSGRKLIDTTRAVGALPEADPATVAHGHDIMLASKAGRVSPEYLLLTFDHTLGTSFTFDLWLYYADVVNVAGWQKISTHSVSDTLATAPSVFAVPTMGASRAAVILKTQVGGVTNVHYTIRAIDSEEALTLMTLSGTVTDVNIAKVAGSATAATTVAGKLPVEELSVVGTNGINIWHNGGAAKVVTSVAYVAGDWFTASTYCELLVGLQLTAVAAPHLQFYFEWSPDVTGVPAYRCSATDVISAGIEDCNDHVVRFQSVVTGNKTYKFEVFPGKYYRMSARFVDAGGSSLSLLAIGYTGRP